MAHVGLSAQLDLLRVNTQGRIEIGVFVAIGNLTSFSEQQLMDCSTSEGNNGCQGGLMDLAFEYLEKERDESEADYPYTAMVSICPYQYNHVNRNTVN